MRSSGSSSGRDRPDEVATATVRFCRKLRSEGLGVGLPETLAAVGALEHLDLGDRCEVHLGLRTVLAGSVDDYEVFDRVFREFWLGLGRGRIPDRDRRIPAPSLSGPEIRAPLPSPRRGAVSLEAWLRQEVPELAEEEPAALRAPSARESLIRKDFSDFHDDEELREVTQVARRLARRLARRRGRRWKPSPRGTRIHMRRTMRSTLASGGEATTLAYRDRKLRRTKLVVLCDVSGSMDLYSRFLLRFLYALQNCFARVETFVFATRLSRITEDLGEGDWIRALDRLSERVGDWSGGTRIGACLVEFAGSWAELVDRETVIVVLSDGWDTGEPEELGRVLEGLRERAGRVVWLNPLLGAGSYRPVTAGIRAALPHVDVFAPAHNLEALEALGEHLTL